jgi:succinate--hydroxymethylglutarate CoA-transferase
MLARDTVVEVDHPAAGPIILMNNPMRFVGRSMSFAPPPVLGQHTESVIEEVSESASKSVGSGRLKKNSS